jgi:putative ABC transport system permease protein
MRGDLRYAARQLIRRPAWTLMVVSTLALGVGANTSIFTLVDTMLFKPAPWNEDGRLVWITGMTGRSSGPGRMSYPDYVAYRDRASTLSGTLAYSGNGVAIGGGRAEYVNAGLVSGNYFNVLGIRAQIGRTFAPGEDAEPGAHPVVVLSDALWRQHFAADPKVVNRSVAINGQPFTIIGVAPRGFTGIAYADNAERLWMPLAMQRAAMPTASGLLTAVNARWLHVVGRLRDGETAAQAGSEMRVIAGQLNPSGTSPDQQRDVRVIPLRGGMNAWEQNELAPIFGLVAIVPALVLLVACANVANVLMARNVSRRKELAMRQAVGASRGRLVRLLLIESLMLAVLSAAAGFAVSFALTALIVHCGEVDADFSTLLTPDHRALFAATIVAILTTMFFGLAPAATATRFEVLPTLKEETATSTAASGRTRLRRAFVITQVAFSLTLLIVAGLFLRSLSKITHVDPGFEPHRVVTASFDTELLGYTASQREAFVTEFMHRASSMPGVLSAAVTNIVPLGGEFDEASVATGGTANSVRAISASVSPAYFETMRLPLRRGREFSRADMNDAVPVTIVNETLAQRLWPGSNAIGKRIRVDGSNEPWREVIGVAQDAKYVFLSESPRAAYYVPLRREAVSRRSILVRMAGNSRAALSSLANIAHDLDPNLPLITLQTLDERIHGSVNLQRAAASLFSVLGGLTLLLAAVGLYGVAAHSVSLRTREVGIRISLGARGTDVFRMIVRENLSLSLVGVAAGMGISLVGSRILASFLFGLGITDPLTLVGAVIVLCLVTVIASYIPARRAARLDPLAALRHE